MSFTREQIEELIQYLQGTCNTLDGGVQTIMGEEYDDMDMSMENHDQLDMEIFLCDDCGWWYERCEECEEDDGICEACGDYNED